VGTELTNVNGRLQEYEEIFTGDVGESVQNWLDEHPEATTTVEDGSITEAKFTDALKLKTVNGYITPEMYGAKGDGVTDDTLAVINAINAVSDNGTLLMQNTYRITSGITITKSINVIIDGLLLYDATDGVALTLGDANITDTLFKNCSLRLKVKAKTTVWTPTTEFVGIKAINIMQAELYISAANFEKGFALIGAGADCDYNKIFVDTIYNNKIGVSLEFENGGSVNQNTFIGGRIGTLGSSVSLLGEDEKIRPLQIVGYNCNNNAFYTVSFESASKEKSEVLIEGRYNGLVWCRYENIGVIDVENTSFSTIIYGFGLSTTTISNSKNNAAIMSDLVTKFVTQGQSNLVLNSKGGGDKAIRSISSTGVETFNVSTGGNVFSYSNKYLMRNTSNNQEYGLFGTNSIPDLSADDKAYGSLLLVRDGSGKDRLAYLKGPYGWRNVLVSKAAATTGRPTSGIGNGYMMFDTTLNKPIWWNGTDWVDATGTVV
jgi:hypothetical protein